MNRLFKILGGGLGLLILGVLAFALIYTLSGPKENDDQKVTFQSPIPTNASPSSPIPTPTPPVSPIPTPTPAYIQPPLCEFEGEATPPEESFLDDIVFSEPEVVFSREAPIEIIEWLPDNRRLLLHVRDQTQQSIEVLNTKNGQTKVYAEGLQNASHIFWLPRFQAVIYVDHKTEEFSGIDQDGLWISRGNPEETELLLDDVEQLKTMPLPSHIPPEVAEMFNLYDTSPAERWRYPKHPEDPDFLKVWADVPFSASVSPDRAKAVLYGIPWLYLVDLDTRQPCEVELGKYVRADYVKWSPDSRFLAMIVRRTEFPQELPSFSHLAFLDTHTGEIYKPDLGMRYVWDMAWTPNSRHFVAMGAQNGIEDPYQNQQIALIDTRTQDMIFALYRPIHLVEEVNQVFN